MDDITRKLEICVKALKNIEQNFGQVCEMFEICKHESCRSSVSCWMEADKALKEIGEKT